MQLIFFPRRDRKYIEVKITNTTLRSFPFVFHEATTGSIVLAAWLRAMQDGEAHVKKTPPSILFPTGPRKLIKNFGHFIRRYHNFKGLWGSCTANYFPFYVCPNLIFPKGVDNNKSRQLSILGLFRYEVNQEHLKMQSHKNLLCLTFSPSLKK